MSDIKGFLKYKRAHTEYRPVCERVKDFEPVARPRTVTKSIEQAARCMDCGTPFCHWGCPIGNYIPEWNNMAAEGRWKEAYELLAATNNFPEFTGRVCPAMCEYSCVLGINGDPVTIRENELAIIEYAFSHGYVKARKPRTKTGKRAAVIGSGPAGLACADQLNQAGHSVTVFEKDDKAGGILRYGIPDFKLEKNVIDRRLKILKAEGINFKTGTEAGPDYPAEKLMKEFDAVCLTGGSRIPRDLMVEGRELPGVYFAMEYLKQSNMKASGTRFSEKENIDARGKKVVVIGGGDTGADCVGTANRQGASCVVQIEVLDRPSECRTEDYPWPRYPLILKTSTSHEEGADRRWAVVTRKFYGENGVLKGLKCNRVEFPKDPVKSCPIMKDVPGSEFDIETDLVFLAIGFLHPDPKGVISQLRLKLDGRGNVITDDNYMTSAKGVFSAGDMHRGQSLVVWAFQEGRSAAAAIDRYLTSKAPSKRK